MYQIALYDTMLVLAIVLLVSPIIISSEFFFIGISIVSKKSFLDLPFLSMMQYIISSMMEAGVSSLIVMMMAYESTVLLASITSIELLMEPRSTVVVAVHSLPRSGSDKILGTPKRYIFSGSFLYIDS